MDYAPSEELVIEIELKLNLKQRIHPEKSQEHHKKHSINKLSF